MPWMTSFAAAKAGHRLYDFLNAPAKVYRAIHGAETLAAAADKHLATFTEAVVRGTLPVVKGAKAGAFAGRESFKTQAAAREAFQKRVERVQVLAGDPQTRVDTLNEDDGTLDSMPQIASSLRSTADRAAMFLASQVPASPPSGLFGKQLPVSEAQVAEFNRLYATVNRPTSMLEAAVQGTLTPAMVNAVRTVYPKWYASVQERLLARLVEERGQVVYRMRMPLSLILGTDVDGNTTMMSVANNQQVYAAGFNGAPSAPAEEPAPSPSAASITAGQRTSTASTAQGAVGNRP
jgi:hypothetical protein